MTSKIRIAASGGGGPEDSLLIDQVFASWVGPSGKLLYLPIALKGLRPYESCLEWIRSTMRPLGIRHIDMWDDLSKYTSSNLDTYDAVYIGGGNTFSLLAQLRQSGFDKILESRISDGLPVYGGSAGAILLGKDIAITTDERYECDNWQRDLRGLNLLSGNSVWPHYQPEHISEINAYAQKSKSGIYAISEQSGLVIENGTIRSFGYTPSLFFDSSGNSQGVAIT